MISERTRPMTSIDAIHFAIERGYDVLIGRDTTNVIHRSKDKSFEKLDNSWLDDPRILMKVLLDLEGIYA